MILAPGHAFGVKQIGDGGDIGGNLMPGVIVHAEIITGSRSAVIGLGRMGDGKVVGQENSFFGQSLKVCIGRRGVEILACGF